MRRGRERGVPSGINGPALSSLFDGGVVAGRPTVVEGPSASLAFIANGEHFLYPAAVA